jgi:hypothetical protein
MNTLWKIISIILLLILGSCDIFEVRSPESPSETKSGYRVPVEPKDVIQNLISAFNDRNADDYKKNFASGPPLVNRSFSFIPSANVISSFPEDWNVDQEFQYFNNIITRTQLGIPINVTFSYESYDISADSAIYTAQYSISVPIQNSEPAVYGGNLKFTMIRDNNNAWVIYFWEDIAKQGESSWSELKNEFYL